MPKLQCKVLLCQLAQGQYGKEYRLVNAHCMFGSSGDVTLWQALLGSVHSSLFYLFSNRVSLCTLACLEPACLCLVMGWEVYITTPVQHTIPSKQIRQTTLKRLYILSSRPGEMTQRLRTLVQFPAPTWLLATTCDSSSRETQCLQGHCIHLLHICKCRESTLDRKQK